MPYEIKMVDGKHCVFNKSTGDNKGCSDTRDMAVGHMRALYAAESGSIKQRLPGDNVNYNPVGGGDTQACANCQWFMSPDMCNIVSGTVSPTGICDLWHEQVDEPMTDMSAGMDMMQMNELECKCLSCVADDDAGPFSIKAQMTRASINDLPDSAFAYIEPGCDNKGCRHFPIHDKAHVRNALARLSQSPFGDKARAKVVAAAKRMGIEVSGNKSIFESVLGMLRPNPPVRRGLITVTKDLNSDRQRVIMRVSNMFKDRHGEIITSEAHKEYIDWVDTDRENRMPEFWLWHTKGTRWGQADGLAFDDSGFLVATGLVDEGYEHVADALASMNKELGVSHGFFGFGLNKGYIDIYRAFEFSPLPLDQAANIWTAYMLAKEADLPISEAKRKFFIEDLGIPEQFVSQVEAANKDEGAAIKALGIAYKEDEQTTDSNASTDSGTDKITLEDIMAKLDGVIDDIGAIKAKQKEIETTDRDVVSEAMAAAIVAGKGYVASKENKGASAEDQAAQQSNWFDEVVIAPLVGGK